MAVFPNYYGNDGVAETLHQMTGGTRIAQTILLSGPEGVGKATLARRFAASLLGDADKIERDDLSLPQNQDAITEREKWTADKRGDDPLLFSTHPDFMTFTPDGPLRQITIQQMRTLRERAQLRPLRGTRRVFLIDHLERANEQAANSLLKVLEEPPEHLIIFATAENLYDVLPTIRSRSLVLQLSRLHDEEMRSFAAARELADVSARIALAEGCPGLAVTMDLDVYRERRALVLKALECGAGLVPFSSWVAESESFSSRKSEKLELYLKLGYGLLEDLLHLQQQRKPAKNRDAAERLQTISERVDFNWIERAARGFDELVEMVRRNIQKTAALDSLVVKLRNPALGSQA
jgi:DNA polymerase III subunit delta'